MTGPDEYTTVVNNNAYTNLMARENLWYAGRWRVARGAPGALRAARTWPTRRGREWRGRRTTCTSRTTSSSKINPQDDSFLDREVWDLKNTPKDKFPLLLHYHPLVIYRYQVIKQADMVLAMFLLSTSSRWSKKRNFDYYDPLTTGDSSLSACIQCDRGRGGRLRRGRAALLHHRADGRPRRQPRQHRDGIHVASAGGTWLALVAGFAGLRDSDGDVSFSPRLPEQWERLQFRIQVRGQVIEVDITHAGTEYTLLEGQGLPDPERRAGAPARDLDA